MAEIVTVNITRLGQVITRQGFGTPLVLGSHANFLETFRYYFDLDAVADDFLVTQDEYLAARAIFNQSPSVERIAIGRRDVSAATITIDAAIASTSYGLTFDGSVEVSFTSSLTPSVIDIAAGLTTTINGSSAAVTATDNLDGTIGIVPDATPFTMGPFSGAPGPISFTFPPSAQPPSVALALINDENDDWYALALANMDEADVLDAAAWVELNGKLFGTRTDNTDVLDANETDDIASQLKALQYERTFTIYSENAATNFIECAWFGQQLTTDPGTTTWAFKSLAAITADVISTSEKNIAFSKNCNIYVNEFGKDVTRDGFLSKDAFFIDTTRGVDWLQARLVEDVTALIINLPKVPYTDGGISAIEAVIRARLDNAIDVGLLSGDPAPNVSVPKVADIPLADRNIRNVPGITFNATLAGAIHSVEIQGFVN